MATEESKKKVSLERKSRPYMSFLKWIFASILIVVFIAVYGCLLLQRIDALESWKTLVVAGLILVAFGFAAGFVTAWMASVSSKLDVFADKLEFLSEQIQILQED